jgi:3-oxoacyl-[acyl-carrier protein] reductase
MNGKSGFALVTGASRGIGQAILERLGADGLTVVGTATTESGATRVGELLSRHGWAGVGWALDLGRTDARALEESVREFEGRFGPVRVLVNNAGIARDDLMLRMGEDAWQTVLEVDLNAVFRLTRICLRTMLKERRGRIINMASVVALSGNPGQVNYAAAKGGLLGLTRSLAQEVGSRGITVNAVAPGFIETDMTRTLNPQQRERLRERIPLGRLGTPEDVAACVGFLASEGAGYITGETLQVNGGMYMS